MITWQISAKSVYRDSGRCGQDGEGNSSYRLDLHREMSLFLREYWSQPVSGQQCLGPCQCVDPGSGFLTLGPVFVRVWYNGRARYYLKRAVLQGCTTSVTNGGSAHHTDALFPEIWTCFEVYNKQQG